MERILSTELYLRIYLCIHTYMCIYIYVYTQININRIERGLRAERVIRPQHSATH